VALNRLALPALLIAGLAIRLIRLDAALWYDEAFSALLAQRPLESLVRGALGDVHPPAYYLLLWGLGGILESSESILRAPSVMAGVILIGVVYRLGRALQLSRPAVWLAAGLVTFAPFQVYYSQEVRFYALQMLAVAMAALGLVERRWWLLACGSLAALYLHNISAFFVAALFVAGLLTRQYKPLAWSTAAVAIGYIPGALITLYQAQAVNSGYWILPLTFGRVLDTFNDMIFYMPRNPFTITCCFLTSIAVLLVLLHAPRANRLLLIMTFLPVIFVAAVSLLWRPILISRIMAPVSPFFYLSLGAAAVVSWRRLLALAPHVVLIAVILVGSASGRIGRQPLDLTELEFYGLYQPGDGIFHANVGSYLIWKYYLPDRPQYVLKQDNTLQTTLTAMTKEALGLHEANFEDVQALHQRWWFVSNYTPVSSKFEIDESDKIKQKGRLMATFRKDIIADSELFLVENP